MQDEMLRKATAAEIFGLTEEEARTVREKVDLSVKIRKLRKERNISHMELAEQLEGITVEDLKKIERADASRSIEDLNRVLRALELA